MLLFWEQGYDRSSISQLCEVIGISSPSLYAAFGDKQRLFDEAVVLYQSAPDTVVARALMAPTAAEVYDEMIGMAIVEYTQSGRPQGCFVIADPVLVHERKQCRAAIAKRMRKAVKAGDLPPDANPKALADYAWLVLTGLSAHARDGGTRAHLKAVAAIARPGWQDQLGISIDPHPDEPIPTRGTARHHSQSRSQRVSDRS